MKYAKPHLNYQDQLQLLASRGMEIGDEAGAVTALKRIGYYRLSAYTYVFRLPLDGVEVSTARRSDSFRIGTALPDVVALYDFDHRFRRTLLDGLQQVEVGFRVKVAHRLGARSPFGHLSTEHLDPDRCSSPSARASADPMTAFGSWSEEYSLLQRKASSEEYVKHFVDCYDGEVPVWAACEFMTMGCLLGLYSLMTKTDRRRIAEDLGVKNPQVLEGWLKALNVARNHCAHNSRIWNRSTVYPPDKINPRIVGQDLHHLSEADPHKVYFLAAVVEYLLRSIHPETRWSSDFRTTMSKFPDLQVITPQNSMGFVADWKSLPLWAIRPGA